MYLPVHFRQNDDEAIFGLIRENPLATLVTTGSAGVVANHIPIILSGPKKLQAHVARNNPVWQDFNTDSDILAIFTGPIAYVTPNWYETKAETGKVVPTWNYAVVHVYGRMAVHDDPDWIRTQVEALTTRMESAQPAPWSVSDAPADFTESMLKAIVGLEITISRVEAKWKASQNQPERNRQSVIEGLRAEGSEASEAMAKLVADQRTGPREL